MKKIACIIGIGFFVLILATAISGCASAQDLPTQNQVAQSSVSDQKNDGQNWFNSDRMKDSVKNLTAKGYDLTQVQASLDKRDGRTARKLLNQFYDQHPEARPQISLDRIKQSVQNLTTKGFDTSDILKAIDSGDTSKANTLLNQLYQAHPEARPILSLDPAQFKTHIDRLKQQGIDVTEIQKAYDSGDMNKTRDLIRQSSPQRKSQ